MLAFKKIIKHDTIWVLFEENCVNELMGQRRLTKHEIVWVFVKESYNN